jgi:hypothetical protein
LNNYVGNSGVRVRCVIHGRKNLGGVGGDTLGTCFLQKEHLSRCKKTRERNPDIVGGEAREAATLAFATDDGAYTTTVLGRLLEPNLPRTVVVYARPPAYSCMWEGRKSPKRYGKIM